MRAALIAIVGGITIGLAAYHYLLREEPLQVTTATFKPGAVQGDGSVDLARVPTAPADAGPAPHVLPPKAKETGRMSITVRPHIQPGDPLPPPGKSACFCEPVTINVSQYLGPDGSGIIASSLGGEVDVSRSAYTPMLEQRTEPRHFALVTAEPWRDAYTGIIGKRWGRVGVGIGMGKQPGDHVRPLLGVQVSW